MRATQAAFEIVIALVGVLIPTRSAFEGANGLDGKVLLVAMPVNRYLGIGCGSSGNDACNPERRRSLRCVDKR